MKVEESLNVTFDESPSPTKLSPLVDDDVGEEEAIENNIKYIKEMLKKFGLEDSKPTKTPMSTEIKLIKDDEAKLVDSTKYRELALLAEAQESGQILDEEQRAFLINPGIPDGQATQTTIPNTVAFQTEDLDAYDSDYDDISNAKAVLMDNLSNYGSDVISEVVSSQHVASLVTDDEETLILEEVSRSKFLAKQNDLMSKDKKVNTTPINYVELNRLSKHFGKRFVPQQELSDEQALWSQTSHPNTDQSDSSPVQIESSKELLKDSLSNNQNALEIPEYFENKDLKAQLQAKVTTICKLKEHIKSMRENSKEKKVKHDMDEIETIKIELEHNLKGQIQEKVFVTTALQNELRNLKGKKFIDNDAIITNATTIAPGMFKIDLKPLAPRIANNSEPNYSWGSNTTDVSSSSSLANDSKFMGTIRFENDQIAKIMGYGDYQLGNVIVSRVYYVEGLGHNLFSVRQFCDAGLEVAFLKNSCFIQNLEDVDLLSGSRDTNLYTISLDDMLKTSPICLLSKASNKSWLWHHRLSHLNFGTPNKLAKDSLARSLLKLKFKKDHLSKDEAPDAIIKCIKNIQVHLNATVRNVRIDNGTEFVNQPLREIYENVSITHQTFVARTP
ncbi:integrase, catalytic region, zinc finger, CCHC-type containing protein [Tanacetum coccineum]